MTILQKINNASLAASVSLIVSLPAWAAKPSFIKEAKSEDLNEVGSTLQDWALILLALALVVAAGSAAFAFFMGESDQGKKIAMNICIGAIVFAVIPGLGYFFMTFNQ